MATKSVAGTVAANLSRFTQAADHFITQNSKNKTYVEAGQDVTMAIGNAHYAYEYKELLETLREKVDQTVQGQLDELENMVEVLEKPDDSLMSGMQARVQLFIKSLNFAGWQPQWTGMASRCVYVLNDHFFVTFLGLFKHALASIENSTLTVEGCTVRRTNNQAQKGLSFEIIHGTDFFPESAKSSCHVFQGELEVAYKGWQSEYTTIYPVWIATHPLIALTIDLTTIKTIKKTFSRTIRTGITYTLDPKDSKIGEAIRKQTIFASSGWKITSQPKITSTPPDSVVALNVGDSFELTLTMPKDQETLIAEMIFEESKDIEEVTEKTSTHDIQWGKTVEIPSTKFKIQFQSRDGKTHQVTDQNLQNPYLHFDKTFYGTHKVTALPPTESPS